MISNPSDKAKPNCAVIGVFNLPEAAKLCYLGLYALQHRGQEASGVVSSDEIKLHRHIGNGLVSDVFRDKSIFEHLPGQIAIGHNRYSTTGGTQKSNIQPLLVSDRQGPLAMAHNGNLVNYRSLRNFLEEEGSIFTTSSDTELFLQLMARSQRVQVKDRLSDALRLVKGAYSLVLMNRKKLLAVRDPMGIRPLCLGKRDNGWIVASESCAFDLLGAEYCREIEPGEILTIDENGLHETQFAKSNGFAHCIFEHIYFSRPDSYNFGENVNHVRRELGKNLANEHPVRNADMVIAVPDSSNSVALGFSMQSGIPFELALIRNHYVGRTFIEPEQKMRDFGVKLKFNVVKGIVEGKNLVLIDDSIVRGTTLQKLVRLLRNGGAREIHVRIGSPEIHNPCYYGMDFPTSEELIANKLDVEGIRKHIGADSLAYLSVEQMLDSVPYNHQQDYCTACFTGRYPIQIDEEDHVINIP